MNEFQTVSITLSSDDLIDAYKVQARQLADENVMLRAQVNKLLRDRQLGVTEAPTVPVSQDDLDAWNDAGQVVPSQIVG